MQATQDVGGKDKERTLIGGSTSAGSRESRVSSGRSYELRPVSPFVVVPLIRERRSTLSALFRVGFALLIIPPPLSVEVLHTA